MNTYETKLEQFQGPIHKLLELIEGRELEVSAISLGKVTEDFLGFLESFQASPGFALRPGEEHIQILADFLSVASRLVLLKSKSLIPDLELSREEEKDLQDLELRLKSYQEMKPLFKEVQKKWNDSHSSFARPYFLHLTATILASTPSESLFYPGASLTPVALQNSLNRIISEWQGMMEETEVIRERIITLEEQMKAIVERLHHATQVKLTDFSASQSREELVVVFLALLHLARDQMVFLDQKEQFSDIMVNKLNIKN